MSKVLEKRLRELEAKNALCNADKAAVEDKLAILKMLEYSRRKAEMTLTVEEQQIRRQQIQQQIIDYNKHYRSLSEAEKEKFEVQRRKTEQRDLKLYKAFLAGEEYRQFKRAYEAFCRNKAASAADKARS